ncbi:MAG: DUF4333 domain-containing protein, partial [Mycetocola sp.]
MDCNIYVVNADGSELSLADVDGRSPYWSPDGSRIAFVRQRILHTMAPDGSDVQSLGQNLGWRAAWGPWNPLDPPSVVDTDGLERELKTQIEEQTKARFTSLECPADVEIEAGGTFECTAEDASGEMFSIRVTQGDDPGT